MAIKHRINRMNTKAALSVMLADRMYRLGYSDLVRRKSPMNLEKRFLDQLNEIQISATDDCTPCFADDKHGHFMRSKLIVRSLKIQSTCPVVVVQVSLQPMPRYWAPKQESSRYERRTSNSFTPGGIC